MSKSYAYLLGVVFSYPAGRCGDASYKYDWATPFLCLSLEENHMKQTDNKNHIRNGIHRLCRQTSRLNLYVQNAKRLDMIRVSTELSQLSNQLDKLSNQPKKLQGGLVSKEE